MSETQQVDERPASAGPSSKAKIGVGIFVAINVIIVAVLLLGGGGSDSDDEQSSVSQVTSADDSGSGGSGSAGGTTFVTAPMPPMISPTGTPDTFDREGEGLGIEGAYNWVGLSGTWKTEGGQAMCTGHEGAAAYAVFSTGSQVNGQIQVTMPVLRDGQGVVFRFVDEDNYWALRAVPDFGTWHLLRVVDGKETKVADVFGPIADGTTVAVQLDGNVIAVFFDGAPAVALSDPSNAGANQVGLTMKGPQTTEARFDDVIWTPAA